MIDQIKSPAVEQPPKHGVDVVVAKSQAIAAALLDRLEDDEVREILKQGSAPAVFRAEAGRRHECQRRVGINPAEPSVPEPAHRVARDVALSGEQHRDVEDDSGTPIALRSILQSSELPRGRSG